MGIDGGCFDHIKPLLNKDLLPNFKKIIDNGYSSSLKVTVPPLTIPSWPCLFSGLTPEKLGYYTFIHPEKGLFNSSVWKEKSIFSLLHLKTFVLNVPGTYPAWKVNGEMVTGMMSPSLSCFPPELKYFLNKKWIISGKSIRDIFKAFNMKKSLFLRKLKEDFDFLVYVIRMPDSLSHHANVNRKLLTKYIDIGYKKIDNLIGKILNDRDVENLIIISDHGLKFYDYGFYIKRWLEKKNLLYLNNNKGEKINNLIQKYYRIVKPYFKKFPFKNYYKKVLKIKDNKKKSRKKASIKIKKNTRVQHFIENVGGLFLSNKDISKRDIIQEALENDKDIFQIIKPELRGFPDFFIILKKNYVFITKPSFSVKMKRNNRINHDQFGLFIAYGKKIKIGFKDHVDYINIAPTILNLLNKEKPNYMIGEPLNIFK